MDEELLQLSLPINCFVQHRIWSLCLVKRFTSTSPSVMDVFLLSGMFLEHWDRHDGERRHICSIQFLAAMVSISWGYSDPYCISAFCPFADKKEIHFCS